MPQVSLWDTTRGVKLDGDATEDEMNLTATPHASPGVRSPKVDENDGQLRESVDSHEARIDAMLE